MHPGIAELCRINQRVTRTPDLPGLRCHPAYCVARDHRKITFVPPEDVEDRTQQFIKWCDDRGRKDYDISIGYPPEWRQDGSIWTVCDSGSAHAGVSCFSNASFVYCGIPVPYKVVAFYRNQAEWEQGR